MVPFLHRFPPPLKSVGVQLNPSMLDTFHCASHELMGLLPPSQIRKAGQMTLESVFGTGVRDSSWFTLALACCQKGTEHSFVRDSHWELSARPARTKVNDSSGSVEGVPLGAS